MARNPYHFRYHDDALRGYSKLNLEQRGAYNTLLDLMYSEGGYIEECERRMAAEMGVSTRKYRSLRDQLIKAGKVYYPTAGFLSNRRVEEEIQRRTKRSVKAKESGAQGGRKKAENEALRATFSPQFAPAFDPRTDPRNSHELSENINEINEGLYQTSSSSRTKGNSSQNSQQEPQGVCGTSVASIDAFRKRQKSRSGY